MFGTSAFRCEVQLDCTLRLRGKQNSVSNELGCLTELISKQTVEGANWFFWLLVVKIKGDEIH